ncbi:MAG: metal ABC transporter permease, partial [Betaproteobacteria bacterium]|nr:metal ABC transporter permease [Betaproteobacteria bacterium]
MIADAVHTAARAKIASTPRRDWRVVPMLLPYLWEYKWRVVTALGFLVAAKLANVGVPLILKDIVDGLDSAQAVPVLPLALLVA